MCLEMLAGDLKNCLKYLFSTHFLNLGILPPAPLQRRFVAFMAHCLQYKTIKPYTDSSTEKHKELCGLQLQHRNIIIMEIPTAPYL